ncbi:MAG: hypothetical protein LBR67_00515 [Dysgonamonadaceae bacterium]|jgi:hypothetical protein|nr:hypothetical protein [Dysgonamonadaceae bacterium]
MNLEEIIKRFVPQSIIDYRTKKRHRKQYIEWEKAGKPVPPPHLVKQLIIKEFQNKHHSEILVETGTYKGDMVRAQSETFPQIFTIELSDYLYRRAKKRFRHESHITVLQGDSGEVLHSLLPQLDKPTLFWLDGHYSGGITAKGKKECPIFEELDAIYQSEKPHVLLIDDARLFEAQELDYPSLTELFNYISSRRNDAKIEIKDDVIIVEYASESEQ